MGAANYRNLVIDANALAPMGEFWGSALGLEVVDRDGEILLRGPTPQHAVWIEQVPEPVSTKQRVHLDVQAGSVEDVLDLGASPNDLESFRWKVLRDPEGGELCVFERERVPAYRLYAVVVDCAEPEPIARWWADVLGGTAGHDDGTPSWWVGAVPGMPFEGLVFVPVPESKLVKNRIHWDITVDALAPLVDAGARVLRERDDEIAWTVLADPDGNEFCAWLGE